jgi:drug/metabolite transporter (DMT)-like permease
LQPNRTPLSEPAQGYLLALAAALLSGANYVLGKVVLVNLSPTQLVAMIFSIATILQGGWMLKAVRFGEILRCPRRGWIAISSFIVLSIAALWSLWSGVKYLDPAVAAFISRVQTLVTVFLGICFLRERFRLIEAIGGLIVIVGVAIMYYSAGIQVSFWFWVMFASGVLWGITEVTAKVALRYMDAIPLSFVRTAAVALFFLLLSAIEGLPLVKLGNLWWGVAGIALMGPTLARLVYLLALKRLAVSKAALVNQIQPLFVSLIAFIFLGTIPGLKEWIGGLCILGGCTAMVWGQRVMNDK